MQVATGQVASTGIVALSYVQKVSEKVRFLIIIRKTYVIYSSYKPCRSCILQVSLASEFMYNHMTRDVTSSFGYDYILRQVTS